MPRHQEPLNGGLVTIRDPALLEPGQVSDLRNAVILPDSKALYRADGRVSFGAASGTATDVVGLRDVKFDNGVHVLLAHATASYLSAQVGDAGTFGTLASSVGSGTQLEVVHFRNRFFLLNGAFTTAVTSATAANSNLSVFMSATGQTAASTGVHGLLPVASQPFISTAAGTFSQPVTGYYEYWTTEVSKYTQDGVEAVMEGTFVGQPTTVLISATAVVPTIQRPDVRNSAATHWLVYRSPKKDKQTDKEFPIGFAITAPVSTAATSVADTTTVSNTGFIFPANENGAGGDGATVFADFANASNLGADDGNMATALGGSASSPRRQGAYGFNFGGFTGSVKGIEVVIEAFWSVSSAPVSITLSRSRHSTGGFIPPSSQSKLVDDLIRQLTVTKSVNVGTVAGTTYTLGGSTDRWFASDARYPFSDTDFGTNWMVVIGTTSNAAQTLSVDYVKVKVYYGGSIDSVVVFPTVVYTFGDVSAQVGKNGPPPTATTGDLYEDSLVLNDVTNAGIVRFSYPGSPDAFPETYFIDFETRENDKVTLIKTVNDRLVVGLDTSIWRVNYLPSERDASFDRGRAKEVISSSLGVVNPMCACTFSMEGGRQMLAFVSTKGVHTTDGYSLDNRTNQLDWRQIQPLGTTIAPIALIDDPENQQLLFYYRNDALTPETYLCLHLLYARSEIDEQGNFKASGLVHMRNYESGGQTYASLQSAWSVRRADGTKAGDTSIYLGYGGSSTDAGAGKVYIETGTAIPANDPAMHFTTRRMFLAGEGSEWKMNELYFYTGSHDSGPTFSVTALNLKTNASAEAVTQVKSKTLTSEKLWKLQFNQIGEGVRLSAVATASALEVDYLLIDGDDFGAEDSGL